MPINFATSHRCWAIALFVFAVRKGRKPTQSQQDTTDLGYYFGLVNARTDRTDAILAA